MQTLPSYGQAKQVRPTAGVRLGRDLVHGVKKRLYDWHVDHAFDGVPKKVLKELVRHLKPDLRIQQASEKNADSEESRDALSCMLKIRPTIEMHDAIAKLKAKGTDREADVSVLRQMFDDDLLQDLVAREDMSGFKDFIRGAEVDQWKTHQKQRGVVKHVDGVFKATLSPDDYKAQKDLYKEKTKVPWISDLPVGLSAVQITQHLKPQGVNVTRNLRDGNFVVSRRSKYIKAFSWQMLRRPGLALKLALRKAWGVWAKENALDVPARATKVIDSINDDAMLDV